MGSKKVTNICHAHGALPTYTLHLKKKSFLFLLIFITSGLSLVRISFIALEIKNKQKKQTFFWLNKKVSTATIHYKKCFCPFFSI